MFAKSRATVGEHNAKGSDAKKLRAQLFKIFPLLGSEQLDSIWPVGEQLKTRKLDGRLFVYFVSETPIFYTEGGPAESGKWPIHPTMYLLHAAPQIVPTIVVHSGVGRNLMKGADLFMPGVVMKEVEPGKSWVLESFGKFSKGDTRAVVEEGSVLAVAIATWRVSHEELEYQGMKGRGLDLVHHIGDCLWEFGPKNLPDQGKAASMAVAAVESHKQAAEAEAQAAAAAERERRAHEIAASNAAFIQEAPKLIKKLEKAIRQGKELQNKVKGGLVPDNDQKAKLERLTLQEEELANVHERVDAIKNPKPSEASGDGQHESKCDATANSHDRDDDDGGEQEVADDWEQIADSDDSTASVSRDMDALDEAQVGEGEEAQAEGVDETADENADEAEDEEETDSGPNMEEIVMTAFLLALHTLKQSELPILVSTFYANFMLPASKRTGFRELNIKETKYKKFNQFLKEAEKDGIITLREVKAGVLHISQVNRIHDAILEIDPSSFSAGESESVDRGFTTWSGQLPKKGAKQVEIAQKKVRGNKNLTVISGLENFGIKLSEPLRKDLARHFSVAVTFAEGPDASKGKLINVQGKYVMQLANYVTDILKIPKKLVRVDAKGTSKRDRAINV